MFLSFSPLSYKKSEYGLFIEINVYRKVSRALMFVSKQCLCICLTWNMQRMHFTLPWYQMQLDWMPVCVNNVASVAFLHFEK